MGAIVVTVALGMAVFSAIVVVGWRLSDLIERRTERLDDAAAAQGKRLTVMAAEVQYARKEILRLQSELSLVRTELEGFIHGPPSMTRPVR